MWKQLTQVKESKGRLGILATRRALYRAKAEEGCDMVEHISNMRRLQEELHMMESLVSDEDFVMLLITSLPESWDNYTSSFLGASGNQPTLSSHEFIANLIEEDKRRKGWNDNAGTAMQAGKKKGQAKKASGSGSAKECYNCHKKGHVKADCWNKGGGKEGEGPKGRNKTQQASEVNTSLNDVAYMVDATFSARDSSKLDWFADSCTTSHICTVREAFTTYTPLKNATVSGIGPNPAVTRGRGTVTVNFAVDGKTMQHTLQNVLHVPEAPNCLLSIPRLDESGGWAEMKGGKCTLRDKTSRTIGYGWKVNRMYKLEARANLQDERAQYAKPKYLSWEQWHWRFGHLSISSIKTLNQQGLVDGLHIDESSIPPLSCESCIQAKQTHKKFPQEAEHRAKVPGERFMADVWGPAKVTSVGRFKYYISFTDDNTRYVTVLFLGDKSDAYS
ncbi:hypothetical protein H1R20_g11620, partial [Candolleomyces eurysporus]